MITETDVDAVANAARPLPDAGDVVAETDFVTNLLVTVVDFQMRTTTFVRALAYFKQQRSAEVKTMEELRAVLDRFTDDQEGNTDLALDLWGYRFWTRAAMLRRLVEFFGSIGVVDQPSLETWASHAQFERDFEGRVKGLGRAVFHSLVMRQGVDTVKPDVHVRRFAERAVGRRLSDSDVVVVVVEAARRLGMSATRLDWAIWEHGRRGEGSLGEP